MPEVFLDGERVQFDGPPPASLEALLAVLEPALDGAGRLLAGVTIDGCACESGVSAGKYGAAGRIDVSSLLIAEAIAQVAVGCGRTATALRGEAERLAQEVLRVAWSELASSILSHGEQLGQLLHGLSGLASHQEMQAAAGELASALNGWMDAVAGSDAAGICLQFDRGIIPALARIEAACRSVAGDRAS